MIRSKDIKDYFDVPLDKIKPFVQVTFDIHLFFSINNHIVVWRKSGSTPTDEWIAEYLNRGIQKIWIHQSDRDAYLAYSQERNPGEIALDLNPQNPPVTAEEPENPQTQNQEKPADPPEEPAQNPPSEAIEMNEVVDSQKLSESEKKKIISEKAEEILQSTFQENEKPKKSDQDREDQERKQKARDIVRNFVKKPESVKEEDEKLLDTIWSAAQTNRELEHAANVGTLAVLFAMSFGNMQRTELWELATAGLLHDLGLGQIGHPFASKPWAQLNDPTTAAVYHSHVNLSIELLREMAPDLPDRVYMMVREHHEKFDGSGYPNRIKSFDINDFSQLIAVADLVDGLCFGRFDGERRGLDQGIKKLKELEKSATFPSQFNPEILRGCMKAIHQKNILSIKEAANIVGKIADQMTGSEAA